MDKNFVLNYLRLEHLKESDDLYDIAKTQGVDFVKGLFRDHETLRLYVPNVTAIKDLMHEVVMDNYSRMQIHELKRRTGLSYDTIRRMTKT